MQTLADINRLLVYISPHAKAWQLVQTPLLTTKNIIEDIYYEHVLQPRLKKTFKQQRTAYERCIMYILWVIGRETLAAPHDQCHTL